MSESRSREVLRQALFRLYSHIAIAIDIDTGIDIDIDIDTYIDI